MIPALRLRECASPPLFPVPGFSPGHHDLSHQPVEGPGAAIRVGFVAARVTLQRWLLPALRAITTMTRPAAACEQEEIFVRHQTMADKVLAPRPAREGDLSMHRWYELDSDWDPMGFVARPSDSAMESQRCLIAFSTRFLSSPVNLEHPAPILGHGHGFASASFSSHSTPG